MRNLSDLKTLALHPMPYIVKATSHLRARGVLPDKPIRDVPFSRVSFFSINSGTGNEN